MGRMRQWGVPEVGATVHEELSQRSPIGPVQFDPKHGRVSAPREARHGASSSR